MEKNKSKFITLLVLAVFGLALTAVFSLNSNNLRAQQQELYTGNENHAITLDQAVKYVQNYTSKPEAPTIKGAYFGRNIFDKMLSQSGCIGIRYYYAKKDDGSPTLVLVGVDTLGNDLTKGILAEEPMPCPPYCPLASPLNK